MTDTTTPSTTDDAVDPVDRVLARADARSGVRVFGAAQALQDESTVAYGDTDGEQWDREERAALRRVPAGGRRGDRAARSALRGPRRA